ncbi:MAG: hypothetical protein QNJ13_05265 [Paracoccaceae bacterium]|nr:hypothetical protein [Paracoccaceae bacterium]
MGIFAALFGLMVDFVLVPSPAVVAALAYHRMKISTGRNRPLYGALCLTASVIAGRVLGDAVAGVPTELSFAVSALATPLAWGLVMWVTQTPERASNADAAVPSVGPQVPEPPFRRAAPGQPGPLLLEEPLLVATSLEEDIAPSAPGRNFVFRTRNACEVVPLPFVPGREAAS